MTAERGVHLLHRQRFEPRVHPLVPLERPAEFLARGNQPQERRVTPAGRQAVDTMFYTEREIARLMRVAFQLALQRARPGRTPKVTSVDKANVLATSRLWREVAHEVAREYPNVILEDQLVDSCAMALVRRPTDFDVIATENTFGDILSDEASMLAGSMGMLPSASLAKVPKEGVRISGLYEPIHGSAPKHTGQKPVIFVPAAWMRGFLPSAFNIV